MSLLIPNQIYSVKTAALAFGVHECSIYQSMPGAARPKLGRCLPEPVRFGRAIRWSGQQLIDFLNVPVAPVASLPATASVDCLTAQAQAKAKAQKRAGRPRKVMARTGGAA